jgi:hypothetical protein
MADLPTVLHVSRAGYLGVSDFFALEVALVRLGAPAILEGAGKETGT